MESKNFMIDLITRWLKECDLKTVRLVYVFTRAIYTTNP